jgi:hypothetical protein
MSESAMFSKDFLTASPSEEELTKCLKVVRNKMASWPQGENTDKLKFIAKNIGESALQKHASFEVRLLVACIAADILRVFAPDAPYDRDQLQSIFSLFLSSFYQLCNPTSHPQAFYMLQAFHMLQTLAHFKAFSLAAAEEVSEDMLENLLATVSSICRKGVVVTAESLLADCIVDFTEECNPSSMSTLLLDTFFEPISTCKNFDTNQNARVFIDSLKRSPALQDAASQYLFDRKQKNGIESDLRDSVIDIIAAIAPIAPMPALADDLKFDVDAAADGAASLKTIKKAKVDSEMQSNQDADTSGISAPVRTSKHQLQHPKSSATPSDATVKRVTNKILSSALGGVSARTLQRYVKDGMPRHCAVAAHTWWVNTKAKAAQQPRKKQYIGKPGDMRMEDLARQLNLSPSYTGQLVKKGMPATSKEAALAWRTANVCALSVQDDLYVTTTHLYFDCFRN